jgi:hypothetical protein
MVLKKIKSALKRIIANVNQLLKSENYHLCFDKHRNKIITEDSERPGLLL